MIQKRLYRDECDICKKMKVCKGFNGLVSCEDCRKNEAVQQPKVIGDKNEQTRFNF